MSIKGFTVDGQDYQYNYPNLDNLPEITPESIGAVSQEDFSAFEEEVESQIEQNKDDISALKSASYNLIDPTGITPYQPTSAAELTRTGFIIKNTTEATYSRGYLYLNLEPNTEYTFSAKKHTTSGVAYVGYSEAPAEGEPFPSANISLLSRTAPDDETISKTFTTTTGILVIRFYAAWDTAELGEVEYSEIMVIEGAEEKPYVRHVFAQDDEARNAINNPQTGLDQKAGLLRNTVSGAIVSFIPDASVKDLLGLTVAAEPVQDLHGYDAPWPAGGGVNLLSPQEITGEMSDVQASSNGDKLTINGTASAYGQVISANTITLDAGTYFLKIFVVSGSVTGGNLRYQLRSVNGLNTYGDTMGKETFSLQERTELKPRIIYTNGTVISNYIIQPMVVRGSAAPTTFSPYSNICPITGWTEANIHVSPTTDAADGATYSITFPSAAGTVYGGTLDVTTGKLTVDRKFEPLNSLTSAIGEAVSWVFDSDNNVFSTNKTVAPTGTAGAETGIISSCYATRAYGYNGSYATETSIIWAHTSGTLRVRDTRFTDVNSWLADVGTQTICYPLATPIVYDLTPQTIETIKGQINNVWADAGNVTVEFAEDIKSYIDKKFAELQALALENN